MRLTANQQLDLATIRHFIPRCISHIPITDTDVEKFLAYSERGDHKEDVRQSHFTDGFNALASGKVWRGRHMAMYEDGILDGSVPYSVLVEDMPPAVRSFIAKEMFKGADAAFILSL